METLYVDYLSQPSRAVIWLCKLNHHEIKHEIIRVNRLEHRSPTFLKINPRGKIPVLQDGSDFILTDSHAIMSYLCNKYNWEMYYPRNVKDRARVEEYMYWHDPYMRRCAQIFLHTLLVKVGKGTPNMEKTVQNKEKFAQTIAKDVEIWFRNDQQLYIANDKQVTIADLACYQEIIQLKCMNLLKDSHMLYPRLTAWMDRMTKVPGHDEILQVMKSFFQRHGIMTTNSNL